MMLRVLVLFIILMASITIGLQLHQDPGHVLIAFHHWTIESTLGVALIAIIMFFLVLRLIGWLISSISNAPGKYIKWLKSKRTQRAEKQTRQGLIEFTEGQWKLAKKHLTHAMPDTSDPLVNYLTAARAAQELGDSVLRDHYLEQARVAVPDAEIGISLTKSELQIDNRQFELALRTLEDLHARVPNHPYVLKHLIQVNSAMGNYAQCMLLLPECKRLHVLPKNQLQALEQKLYLQTLQEHILNDELDTINSFIDKLPKELSNDSAIQTTYADYLIRKQQDITAETILRKGLQIKLDDAMLDLYGQLTSGCAERTFIVKLLKKQPNNGRLWLCLAQIDTKNSLWGQAIHAFESSIQAQPTPQAYAGLATLFEQLNDKEQALKIYRAGLDLVLCKTLVNTLD